MEKKLLENLSKEGQNEVALQYATKGVGYIEYDPKAPLVISEKSKILRIFEKEREHLLELERNSNEDIELKYKDFNTDDEDEEFSLEELINREFNHYDDVMDEEEVSYSENEYRKVRIEFENNSESEEDEKEKSVYDKKNEVLYSIEIFTCLSLDEIEQRLLNCNSEEDIEAIQEDDE